MADNGEPPHNFSEGEGFGDPYEGFDLDPEFDIDPSRVDPVDSRVLTDRLDVDQLPHDQIDVDRLIGVGVEYTQINRYEQATETFERAARLATDEDVKQEAWVNKGAAHAQLDEFDAAIGAYKDALQIDDENEHAASAETNLAYALWEAGRSEQALSHAERAVEIDPRFAQAWYNRGFFLTERGLAEEAVNCFNNAIRLGFRNADILEEKAQALEEIGEDEEAEEVAAEAEEMRQQAESRMME
jgi:tetratricopeptide (TPR) repeat protein